ncbi:MAG TPA: hypothetical protein VFV38_28450 [Ktedonobacteraceae bacterium]|nr:hypothetical protein [Ktedonobacteraceae bacterium]
MPDDPPVFALLLICCTEKKPLEPTSHSVDTLFFLSSHAKENRLSQPMEARQGRAIVFPSLGAWQRPLWPLAWDRCFRASGSQSPFIGSVLAKAFPRLFSPVDGLGLVMMGFLLLRVRENGALFHPGVVRQIRHRPWRKWLPATLRSSIIHTPSAERYLALGVERPIKRAEAWASVQKAAVALPPVVSEDTSPSLPREDEAGPILPEATSSVSVS